MNIFEKLYLQDETCRLGMFQVSPVLSTTRFKDDGGQSVESAPVNSPEQIKLQKALNRQLLNADRTFKEATPFGGERVAGVSDFTTQALKDFQDSIAGGFDSTKDFLTSLASGESQFDSGGAETFSPTETFDPAAIAADFRKGFAEPLLNVFNDILLPQIEESFNLPGTFNTSTRATGVSRASSEFVNKNISPRLFDANEAGRARAFAADQNAQNLNAASAEGTANREFGAFTQAQGFRLPAIGALQGQASNQLGQILASEDFTRSIEQQGLDATFAEFSRLASENNPNAQLAAGFAFNPTQENLVFTEPDRIGQLLGAGATLGGAALLAGSDSRIKENVAVIESPLDKIEQLTGYTYNYTFESVDSRHGGIMAQDLENVLSDAVTEDDNGIKYVRYDAVVGLLVEAVNELHNKIKGI